MLPGLGGKPSALCCVTKPTVNYAATQVDLKSTSACIRARGMPLASAASNAHYCQRPSIKWKSVQVINAREEAARLVGSNNGALIPVKILRRDYWEVKGMLAPIDVHSEITGFLIWFLLLSQS
jgi:hypothetical protein